MIKDILQFFIPCFQSKASSKTPLDSNETFLDTSVTLNEPELEDLQQLSTLRFSASDITKPNQETEPKINRKLKKRQYCNQDSSREKTFIEVLRDFVPPPSPSTQTPSLLRSVDYIIEIPLFQRKLGNWLLRFCQMAHLYLTYPTLETRHLDEQFQCQVARLHKTSVIHEFPQRLSIIWEEKKLLLSSPTYESIQLFIFELFWTHGFSNAISVISGFDIPFLKINPAVDEFKKTLQNGLDLASCMKLYQKHNLRALETRLDYKFRQLPLLICALSHKFSPHFLVTGGYMNLAFFGDAVMDVFLYLYLLDLSKTLKQDLTLMHKSFKAKKYFVNIGYELKLRDHIIRKGKIVKDAKNTSKVYANLFKSLAGAMFIDLDLNMEKFYPKMVELIGEKIKPYFTEVNNSLNTSIVQGFQDNTSQCTLPAKQPDRAADSTETNRKTIPKISQQRKKRQYCDQESSCEKTFKEVLSDFVSLTSAPTQSSSLLRSVDYIIDIPFFQREMGKWLLKFCLTAHLYFTYPSCKKGTKLLDEKFRCQVETLHDKSVIDKFPKRLSIIWEEKKLLLSSPTYESIQLFIFELFWTHGFSNAISVISDLHIPFLEINSAVVKFRKTHLHNGLDLDTCMELYQKHNLHALETRLDYKFRQLPLLICALSHKFSPYFHITGSYMNLAFFGDAVMDVFLYLYLLDLSRTFKQDVTLIHDVFKSNKFFAKIGYELRLRDHIISDGNMGEAKNTSKVFSDLFESLAGAMFIEFDLDMEKFYPKMMKLIGKKLEAYFTEIVQSLFYI